MKLRVAALAVLLLVPVAANAAPPNMTDIVYRSITPGQMIAILTANGATAREERLDNASVVLADTPVGKMEVRFADCAEAPNPCGYILIKRYRGLALTEAQMNRFNALAGFGYAFREAHSTDVLLAYPVAVRTGVGGAYIASTFALLTGITDVFEGFVTDTLHVKFDRIHAE